MKAYKAKSLKGAQARVRQLQKKVAEQNGLLNRLSYETMLLAKLAAETPQFYNPIDVLEAKQVRDHILSL